jgi:hypothetical protein
MTDDAFGIMQKIGPYLITKAKEGDFVILDGSMNVVNRDIGRFDDAIAQANELVNKMQDPLFPEPSPPVPEQDEFEVDDEEDDDDDGSPADTDVIDDEELETE